VNELAERLFAERGFARTSMDELARAGRGADSIVEAFPSSRWPTGSSRCCFPD
jgi:Bacterial regulatory proteins, tetR family